MSTLEKYKYAQKSDSSSKKACPRIVATLLAKAHSEYRDYLWKSASKFIPMIFGSYITFVGLFAVFVTSGSRRFSDYSTLFIVISVVWLLWLLSLGLHWFNKKPISDVGKH